MPIVARSDSSIGLEEPSKPLEAIGMNRTKILLSVFVFVYPSLSYSDVITCSFTEPFITTTYDTSTQLFIVKDEDEKVASTIADVSFEVRARSRFVLLRRDKSEVQELVLNGHGSDGMSEKEYPYDVTWTWRGSHLVGGCRSNALRARETDESGP
jgi:uncharacterized membrane protein